MTVVKQNDMIKTAMILEDEMAKINQFLSGKCAPGDLSTKEKDTVCKLYRDKIKNDLRNEFNLCIDHQKMARQDFTDTWAGEVKTQTSGSTTTTSMRIFNTKVKPRSGNQPDDQTFNTEYCYIDLTPKEITGYVNLKKKYQFFHINKISVRFVANSVANLTPIICKYIPPMDKDPSEIELDQVTKYAQSVGQMEGYVSIHSPYYLIHTLQVDANNKVTDKIDSTYPVLYNHLLKTDMEDIYKVNYGRLVFECKNMTGNTVQNFIAKISYEIDFYTGIDYDNVEVSETPDNPPVNPPDGGDDGGSDNPGSSNAGSTRVFRGLGRKH